MRGRGFSSVEGLRRMFRRVQLEEYLNVACWHKSQRTCEISPPVI